MYEKPKNPLRSLLQRMGVLLYRCGCDKFITNLSPNRVRALLYHAVEDVESDYTQGLGASVDINTFDQHLAFYKQNYNVVAVSRLTETNLPQRPLIITFDDGYTSVKDNALPSLKKHDLPACVYLISRAVENRLVWVNQLNWAMINYPDTCREVFSTLPELTDVNVSVDNNGRARIIRYLQNFFSPSQIEHLIVLLEEKITFEDDHSLYLHHDEILAMQSDKIEFGFHTRDHYNLASCDEQTLEEQFDSSSVDALTNNNTFAYPFGFFNKQTIRCASNKGYGRLMTVGNNNIRFSAKHLDRIEIMSPDPAVIFAQLEVVEPVIALLRRCYLKLRFKPAPALAPGQ